MTTPKAVADRTKAAIAARIVEARLRASLTQADLAAKLGTQPWTVSRWEHARQTPRGHTLQALAAALGVEVGWLVGESAREDVDVDERDPEAENPALSEVRALMQATDDEIRWLASSPRFHRATVGSMIDALRADRQGMSPEQAEASRIETERFRDPTVPRRKP